MSDNVEQVNGRQARVWLRGIYGRAKQTVEQPSVEAAVEHARQLCLKSVARKLLYVVVEECTVGGSKARQTVKVVSRYDRGAVKVSDPIIKVVEICGGGW